MVVLALAGFVWFAWALSVLESAAAAVFCGALDAMFAGGLIWAGLKVRRKAHGFRRADLRLGSEELRIANRRTSARLLRVILAEWTGIGLTAFATYHFGRGDLFPPAMSLVIALHFFPLAHLFRLPVYRATASVSSLICLAALVMPAAILPPDARLVMNCTGFGATMWATALYCAIHSERLAARAAG